MKYQTPISVHNLFQISPRHTNLLICLPKIHLSTSKENFLFKASRLWNNLINIVLNKCKPMINGLLVPGSMVDSDMGASITVVKFKVKMFLLKEQEHGDQTYWTPRNFYGSCWIINCWPCLYIISFFFFPFFHRVCRPHIKLSHKTLSSLNDRHWIICLWWLCIRLSCNVISKLNL